MSGGDEDGVLRTEGGVPLFIASMVRAEGHGMPMMGMMFRAAKGQGEVSSAFTASMRCSGK